MTSGPIKGHLLSFAIPLLLGNFFQLAYNAVDAAIAGRFIGEKALAAEGVATPVMNIIILSVSGLCIGSGILMSELFGAKKEEELKEELGTTLLFGLFLSLLIIILGTAFINPLLTLLNVPGDLRDYASIYLRIIFLGAPFTYFYNALSSALKSVGDSKTPLKFLMFSSILNALLDLFLIGFLGYGIKVSAATTVVAEAVSAALTFFHMHFRMPILRIRLSHLKPRPALLRKTLSYGTVTALQQSVQPIGKLLIQGSVNALGVATIAAYNAATRMDDFACIPAQSVSSAISTFIAQNRGAKKDGRIYKGFGVGIALEVCYFVLIFIVAETLKGPFMALFTTSSEVREIGSSYLALMALFYICPCLTNGIQGFFRGMGKLKVTLFCTFLQTSVRVIVTMALAPSVGIRGIAIACFSGWALMILFEYSYFFVFRRRECQRASRPSRP